MNGELKIILIFQFLSLDMIDNIIIVMILNSISDSYYVRIYKVNKRNQVRVFFFVNRLILNFLCSIIEVIMVYVVYLGKV